MRTFRAVRAVATILAAASLGAAPPVAAQTVADSVDLLAAAVAGYRSPNGPLIEFARQLPCGDFVRPCSAGEPAREFSPAMVAALAKALNLPPAPDAGTVGCPWGGSGGARIGLVLLMGVPRFVTDTTASVAVGRRCVGPRGGFQESGSVSLRRRGGTWQVTEIRNRVMT